MNSCNGQKINVCMVCKPDYYQDDDDLLLDMMEVGILVLNLILEAIKYIILYLFYFWCF